MFTTAQPGYLRTAEVGVLHVLLTANSVGQPEPGSGGTAPALYTQGHSLEKQVHETVEENMFQSAACQSFWSALWKDLFSEVGRRRTQLTKFKV